MPDREPFQLRVLKEDPAEAAARKEAAARGRRTLAVRRWTSLVWPKHRAELHAVAAASVGNGLWWGTGTLVRHIAIDLFTPVALCLAPLGGTTSSDPEVGPLCPRCVRLRKRALADAVEQPPADAA